MSKPIEEMTREEIDAERAALAAERLATIAVTPEANAKLTEAIFPSNGAPPITTAGELREALDLPADGIGATIEAAKADEPAPWPHQRMSMDIGSEVLELEVRKPSESALVAVSMSSLPGLTPQAQMKIFATFFTKHLSITSMGTVLATMADPDSGLDIGELIKKMVEAGD